MDEPLLSWPPFLATIAYTIYTMQFDKKKRSAITIFPTIFMLHAIIRMLLSSALHFTATSYGRVRYCTKQFGVRISRYIMYTCANASFHNTP